MKGLLTSQLLAANPFLQIVLAGWALLLGAVQWLLGLLREGGILVFAAVIPLAAAGGMNEATKPMLPRIISPLAALVFYKPIAAIIYTIGFALIGTGQDLSTIFTGLVVLVLASVAMPAMMRFFAFTQVQMSSGSGVSGALAAGATGAASLAMLRGAAGGSMTTSGPGTARRAPPPAARSPAALPRVDHPAPLPGAPCPARVRPPPHRRRRARPVPAQGHPPPDRARPPRHPPAPPGRRPPRPPARPPARPRAPQAPPPRRPEPPWPPLAGPRTRSPETAHDRRDRPLGHAAHVRQLVQGQRLRHRPARRRTDHHAVLVALLVPIAVAYVSGRAALVAGGAAPGGDRRPGHPDRWPVAVRRRVAAGAVLPGPGGGLDRAVGRRAGRPPRGHDLPGPWPRSCRWLSTTAAAAHALLWDRRTGSLTAILRCARSGWISPTRIRPTRGSPAGARCWPTWATNPWSATSRSPSTPPPPAAPRSRDPRRRPPRPAAPAPRPAGARRTGRRHPGRRADGGQPRLAVASTRAAATPKPADLLAAVVEVGRWLPGIETALAGCGVAVQGRATLDWLTGRCGPAFDPAAARPHPPGAHADHASCWRGRTRCRSPRRRSWDHYRHESGVSVTWALREAPRQAVDAAVLAPLVAPGPYARRVRWLYQPYPADQAAAKVEAQVTAGQIRRAWAARTRRDETQRDRDDRDRALQAAREEAAGAGVGRFTLYITTTVTDARRAVRRGRRRRATRRAGQAAAAPPARSPSGRVRRRPRHGYRPRRRSPGTRTRR